MRDRKRGRHSDHIFSLFFGSTSIDLADFTTAGPFRATVRHTKVSTLPRRTRLPMPASSPAARAIPPAYISRVSRSHHASHARRAAAASASSSSVAAAAQPAVEKEALKRQILRLSALTDRGQLLFQQAAYAPLDKYNAAGPRTSYLHTLSLTVYSRRVDPSLRASRWERAVTRYAPKNT